MAIPEYYTGDTWPPLTGTLKNAAGAAVDISTSTSLRMIAKATSGSTVIEGVANFCATTRTPPGTGDGTDGRVQYLWQTGDLDIAATYVPEIEVTWDGLSSPPKIETFRLDASTFIVHPDND